MSKVRIIEIKKGVMEENDAKAKKIREDMIREKTFLLNLMSSPGSGKTTTLVKTIEKLKDDYKIGVIEADIDSDVDAYTIQDTGTEVIQLHSGGACHLDATMARQGIDEFDYKEKDILIIENIGNLICTAGFDLGQAKKIMILSVPEGHDKPLKYPRMFEVVDAIIVNKIDVMDFFDFDLKLFETYARKHNPDVEIFPISAKTGEGIDEWVNWLKREVDSLIK